MQTHAMQLDAWGVTELGTEANAVVGGTDLIDVVVRAVVVEVVSHWNDFMTGLRDGFRDAQ
ncbi:MAG: hypothetical protein IRZ00_14785 [Gemmatimonadetes bacterium]|nr:hypothetical protein [Gemmatimonadota bacterium]